MRFKMKSEMSGLLNHLREGIVPDVDATEAEITAKLLEKDAPLLADEENLEDELEAEDDVVADDDLALDLEGGDDFEMGEDDFGDAGFGGGEADDNAPHKLPLATEGLNQYYIQLTTTDSGVTTDAVVTNQDNEVLVSADASEGQVDIISFLTDAANQLGITNFAIDILDKLIVPLLDASPTLDMDNVDDVEADVDAAEEEAEEIDAELEADEDIMGDGDAPDEEEDDKDANESVAFDGVTYTYSLTEAGVTIGNKTMALPESLTALYTANESASMVSDILEAMDVEARKSILEDAVSADDLNIDNATDTNELPADGEEVIDNMDEGFEEDSEGSKAEEIVNNYINGNLRDFVAGVKEFGGAAVLNAIRTEELMPQEDVAKMLEVFFKMSS